MSQAPRLGRYLLAATALASSTLSIRGLPVRAQTGLTKPSLIYAAGGKLNPSFDMRSEIDGPLNSQTLFRNYRLWLRTTSGRAPRPLPWPATAGPTGSDPDWQFDDAGWSQDGRWIASNYGLTSVGSGAVEIYTRSGRPIQTVNRHYKWTPFGLWAVDSDEVVSTRRWGVQLSNRVVPLIQAASVGGRLRRIWPRSGQIVTTPPSSCYQLVGWDSYDIDRYLLTGETLQESEIQLSKRAGEVAYSMFDDCRWYGAHTNSNAISRLPFQRFGVVAMNFQGTLAGRLPDGHMALIERNFTTETTLGRGYGPAWSPDGKYFFFLRRDCGPNRHYHVRGLQQPLSTTFCSSEVVRTNADGSEATVVTRQDAYGFAHLNVLSDDNTVVFTRIPNEYRLWRNRGHLRFRTLAKYSPQMDIEIATLGHKPSVLIPNAHLPEVQPKP